MHELADQERITLALLAVPVLAKVQYSQALMFTSPTPMVLPEAWGSDFINSAVKTDKGEDGAEIPIVRRPAPDTPTGKVNASLPVFDKGPFTKELSEAPLVVPLSAILRMLVAVVFNNPSVRINEV